MAEWLKNICLSPFKFGLDKANFVAVNAISLIFNLYGQRLLKMEMDQIIKSNECKNDRDIFYLYPLLLKEIEQDVGLNTIKIIEGTINDLVFSVPWKAILTELTEITIPNISLTVSISQNSESIYLSALENTNSYFAASKIIDKNQDLLNAYKEINQLLIQFFNRINMEIKLIEITLLNHFKITIHNTTYNNNNNISINNFLIYSFGKNPIKLLEMKNIIIDTKNIDITIQEIMVDPALVRYIPDFYTEKSENNLKLNLLVDTFIMDKLIAKNIGLNICTGTVIVNKLSYFEIDDFILFQGNDSSENSLLTLDIQNNTLCFNKSLEIKIGNIYGLIAYIKFYSGAIKTLGDKLIVISLDESLQESSEKSLKKKFLQINDISTNIVYGDDIFKIDTNSIIIGNDLEIFNTKIEHGDVICIFDKIISSNENKIIFIDTILQSPQFNALSKTIKVIKTNKTVDILAMHARVTNILQIINFATNTINKFTIKTEPLNTTKLHLPEPDLSASMMDLAPSLDFLEEVPNADPTLINLGIQESGVFFEYEKVNFGVCINSANICFNTKSATDIALDILMNEYLVAKICAEYISEKYISASMIKLFLDPEIFDKFNYLFGTLTPETEKEAEPEFEISPEAIKQLQEALERSMVSQNIFQLEKTLNETTKNILSSDILTKQIIAPLINMPSIKILTTTLANLRSAIIDDYNVQQNDPKGLNLKLLINSIHVHLFDKLPKQKTDSENSTAFLCVVIKEILFNKIIEEIVETKTDNPTIRIMERAYSPSKIQNKYFLKIKTGAVIDTISRYPQWKYFIKFAENNMIDIGAVLCGDSLRASIYLAPLSINIREETLLRLLAFFSNSHHIPKNNKQIFIEYFYFSTVEASVNYYPIIMNQIGTGQDILTIKDFKLKLEPQIIRYTDGIDKLLNIIANKWKDNINPDNILQFVPHIKLIQPYAMPIVYLIQITTKYFKYAHNKNKIRAITKKINSGTDLISCLVTYGINQVWELFN